MVYIPLSIEEITDGKYFSLVNGAGIDMLESTISQTNMFYNLMGCRVQNTGKGIYIVNENKALIK